MCIRDREKPLKVIEEFKHEALGHFGAALLLTVIVVLVLVPCYISKVWRHREVERILRNVPREFLQERVTFSRDVLRTLEESAFENETQNTLEQEQSGPSRNNMSDTSFGLNGTFSILSERNQQKNSQIKLIAAKGMTKAQRVKRGRMMESFSDPIFRLYWVLLALGFISFCGFFFRFHRDMNFVETSTTVLDLADSIGRRRWLSVSFLHSGFEAKLHHEGNFTIEDSQNEFKTYKLDEVLGKISTLSSRFVAFTRDHTTMEVRNVCQQLFLSISREALDCETRSDTLFVNGIKGGEEQIQEKIITGISVESDTKFTKEVLLFSDLLRSYAFRIHQKIGQGFFSTTLSVLDMVFYWEYVLIVLLWLIFITLFVFLHKEYNSIDKTR
eukprot:TRINITY_DN5625_c0_g1_i2.p1 TRINITY_DN5625_c0_g1~~TRINITY_DN5625_c0_g1_i2.p1  ORF type:complete len:386 (+),score=48.82 TRINITY_DN5625_c0_g1_i2:66-1223(+)